MSRDQMEHPDPQTPDSESTISDPTDESQFRDFARLVPVNQSACIAFNDVVDKMKQDPTWAPHASNFIQSSTMKRSLTELSGSETDSSNAASASSMAPRIWTGYYRLNLEQLPKRMKYGWIVGNDPDEVDILLTPRKHTCRVRTRHARFTFKLETYAFMVVTDPDRGRGRSVLLNGTDEVRNSERVLWAPETGVTFGELSYKLVRTAVSERTLREQLLIWRKELKFSSFEPPSYLAPTPSPDDYEYNGYIIKSVFAQGSTCSVSAGIDKKNGAAVAVKKMLRNSRNYRMVQNEIEVSKYVGSHPCICRLIADFYSRGNMYSLGEHLLDEIYLIYSPLADERFQDLIAHRNRTFEEHLTFFKQGLEGLAYVHSKGLMHRDMKPGNMAIVPAEPARLVILDFGVATKAKASTDHMVGTIAYLAPEVMALKRGVSSQPYDKSVDIWGFGLSFYQVFCHRKGSWHELSDRIYERIKADLTPGNPVADLLLRMLELNPRARITANEALSVPFLQAIDSDPSLGQPEAFGKRGRED